MRKMNPKPIEISLFFFDRQKKTKEETKKQRKTSRGFRVFFLSLVVVVFCTDGTVSLSLSLSLSLSHTHTHTILAQQESSVAVFFSLIICNGRALKEAS